MPIATFARYVSTLFLVVATNECSRDTLPAVQGSLDGGIHHLQATAPATVPFLAHPTPGPKAQPVLQARLAIEGEAAPGRGSDPRRQQCPDTPFLAQAGPPDARCRGVRKGTAVEAIRDAAVQLAYHLPLCRLLGAKHERQGIRSCSDGKVADHRRDIVDSELQMVRAPPSSLALTWRNCFELLTDRVVSQQVHILVGKLQLHVAHPLDRHKSDHQPDMLHAGIQQLLLRDAVVPGGG